MTEPRMTNAQAHLLREAVHFAHKEVVNANMPIYATDAGTWDQGSWASINTDLLGDWHRDKATGRMIAPEPALVCGSTGCTAGHIVAIAGAKMVVGEERYADALAYDEGSIEIDICYTTDGTYREIDQYAAELIGNETNVRGLGDLFDGSNSIAKVIEIADRLLTSNGHEPTGL